MPSKRRFVLGASEVHTRRFKDNIQLVAFSITITTPNIKYAGTNADVYIEVGGKSHLMDKPGDDFERGDTDTYTYRLNMTLGELRDHQIRLYHNDKGRNSGWYCGRVEMKVQRVTSAYLYLYKEWSHVGWLATDEG